MILGKEMSVPPFIFCLDYNKQLGDNSPVGGQSGWLC